MRKISVFLAFGIPFVFFAVFYKVGALKVLMDSVKRGNPSFLFLFFLFYFFSYFLRALRLKLFFPKLRTDFLTVCICIHTFLNNVLPFRSGEFSLPAILKWFSGIEAGEGIGVLAGIRFLDGFALAFVLFFVSVLVSNFQVIKIIFAFVGIFLFCFVVVLLLLKLFSKKISIIEEIERNLTRTVKGKEFFAGISITVLVWISKLIGFSFFLKSFGFKGGIFEGMFACSFGEITSVLPIHSFAGFGTYETGTVIGLKLFGMEIKEALALSFLLHSAILLTSAFLSFPAYLYLLRVKK